MNSLQEFDHHKDTYRSDIDKAISFSGQSHDFFTRVKAEYLLDLLSSCKASADDRPLEVLDVGCGHGYIHPHLLTSSIRLHLSAVDIAASVVEEARKSNPTVEYKSYDGNRLPFPDQTFDAAFTIAVMHHVPPSQWLGFLKEMRRVIKPGGMMVVFEHNPINPLTQWIVRTCPIDDNAVLLGSRKLSKLAMNAQFDDVQTRYILFTPIDSPRFRQFDKLIGWLPFGAQYFVSGKVP